MSVTLHDKHPPYCTAKNWVARFKTGQLSTEGEGRSGRPSQVTVTENMDAIYSVILDDQRISTKKIAETLLIS
jgi:transposase